MQTSALVRSPWPSEKALPARPSAPVHWSARQLSPPLEPARVFEAGLRLHHIANTAYPIAHRRTIWRHRKDAAHHGELMKAAFSGIQDMGLYVHIPFCEKRCAFCEYTVVDGHDEKKEAVYHEALLKELDLYTDLLGPDPPPLSGFDIGGGTPSLIAARRIGEIVGRVTGRFDLTGDFGMSIETTPKIAALRPDRLAAYRSFGIERISMGLQMVNPRLLRLYSRDLNTPGHNHQAAENIRAAGFRRFNIDLMYGFARQTLTDFRNTLEYTLLLAPDYITLYRMRYKGTRISGEAADIDLKRVMDMYDAARDLLTAAGYQANPGKNGFSRVPGDSGASEYLTRRVVNGTPYLGIGLGAQTFAGNILAYNLGAATKQMDRYAAAVTAGTLPIQDLYRLPASEAMAKMISVSFYFGEIDLNAFHRRFGVQLSDHFPAETAFVLDRKLMIRHRDTLRLTQTGARQINGVIPLFYSNAVKAHLLGMEELHECL